MNSLKGLMKEIKKCVVCAKALPLGPRPVVQAHTRARILVIGQAPGRRVHESGVPWDDASGERLRSWLGVDKQQFYNGELFALVPMGFCYPGTGKSGDLPPRPECAVLWHERLLAMMPDVKLTVLLSQYAHAYYLRERRKKSLTETTRAWKEYSPARIPLPHPSPRNNRWFKRNPWFEEEVIPYLRRRVRSLVG